jgi:caa(3)-type oxidase subunit IV
MNIRRGQSWEAYSLEIAIALLLAFAALSFGVSHVSLGAWGIPVALGIAAFKASIIGYEFMELSTASNTVRLAAIGCLGFVFLLLGFMSLDVATR